jgi:arsenite/tail-anchored protein-transporting ATPase
MSKLPAFLTVQDLRLLLFGGKGWVGKTTCAAAAALVFARRFPRDSVALVSTNPAHSPLQESLAGLSLPENFSVVEFRTGEAAATLRGEQRDHFREIARRGTFLDDQDVERLTDLLLPGIDEFLEVLTISEWLTGQSYDRVVVDTAPTGQTLRLLETPELMSQWLGAMESLVAKHRYMRRVFSGRDRTDEGDSFLEEWSESASRIRLILKDRKACRFVLVTTADRLSIRETARLLSELEAHSLPVTDLVINRLHGSSDELCPRCVEDRRRELGELRLLPSEFARYSLWTVPLYPADVPGTAMLDTFWSKARRTTPANLGSEELPPSSTFLPPTVENPVPLPHSRMALLALAGKGGVGKTTLAAAVALRLARQFPHRKVLLCSSSPSHSLSDSLERDIGPRPVTVRANLSAVEIDAAASFGALKMECAEELRSAFEAMSSSSELPFDRLAMEKLLDLSPPGIEEVTSLADLARIIDEREHDLVVLDTASTGQLLRPLETSAIVEPWLRAFLGILLKYGSLFSSAKLIHRVSRIAQHVRHFRKLMLDPGRAAVYAVSLLAETAFEETRILLDSCDRSAVDAPVLFLNRTTPPCECSTCAGQRARELDLRERFGRSFPERHQVLVSRGDELRGIDRLDALGDALFLPK